MPASTGFQNGVMVANNVDFRGADQTSAQLTADGQLIIGSTGNNPQISTLTAGAGIGITNGAGTITIALTGTLGTWTRSAGPAVALAVDNGYIPTNAALVTFTLPAAAVVGDIIEIAGEGAGLWTIAQNAGQTIQFGATATTTGVGGSLSATNRYDTVRLLCRVTDTTFSVLSSVGVLNAV